MSAGLRAVIYTIIQQIESAHHAALMVPELAPNRFDRYELVHMALVDCVQVLLHDLVSLFTCKGTKEWLSLASSRV